jgi:hypothetical protein
MTSNYVFTFNTLRQFGLQGPRRAIGRAEHTDYAHGQSDARAVDTQIAKRMLREAHLFQVDHKTVVLLEQTDNEVRPDREIYLPFPMVFVDGQFWFEKEDTHIPGFLLYEGIDPRDGHKYVSVHAILKHKAYSGEDMVTDFRCSLSEDALSREWQKEALEDNATLAPEQDLGEVRTSTESLIKHMQRLALNFLDLLDDREVKWMQVGQGQSARRRYMREHRIEPPVNMQRIVLTGELKRWADVLRLDGGSPGGRYSYRFWVRGHVRVLRDPRFKRNEDGSYRMIRVLPYIKGQGILVRKGYEIQGE